MKLIMSAFAVLCMYSSAILGRPRKDYLKSPLWLYTMNIQSILSIPFIAKTDKLCLPFNYVRLNNNNGKDGNVDMRPRIKKPKMCALAVPISLPYNLLLHLTIAMKLLATHDESANSGRVCHNTSIYPYTALWSSSEKQSEVVECTLSWEHRKHDEFHKHLLRCFNVWGSLGLFSWYDGLNGRAVQYGDNKIVAASQQTFHPSVSTMESLKRHFLIQACRLWSRWNAIFCSVINSLPRH